MVARDDAGTRAVSQAWPHDGEIHLTVRYLRSECSVRAGSMIVK